MQAMVNSTSCMSRYSVGVLCTALGSLKVSTLTVMINQPVRSEGTRYFFLSKSPILAFGAFSTMTYKMTQTTYYFTHTKCTCNNKLLQELTLHVAASSIKNNTCNNGNQLQ